MVQVTKGKCCLATREKLKEAFRSHKNLPDDWAVEAKVMKVTERKVLDENLVME